MTETHEAAGGGAGDAVVEGPRAVQAHGLVFEVAAASARGPRHENQDAFAVSAFPSLGIVAVADGMGGERAGRMAADTALQAVTGAAPIRSLDAARYAVRAADEAVARAARESPADREGMGCALALLSLAVDRMGDVGWIAAHVGDVRVLSRSPDGLVRLETRDHTAAFARWEAGEIALDEIPDSPGANRLQRAVGRGGEADAGWIPVRPGWSYLLVSDGVTKAMRLDELGDAMAIGESRAVCEAIARKVEERGPDDNYTAVAVRALAGDDTATVEAPRAARAAASSSPAASPPSAPRAPDGGRGPFNIPDHVNRPSRSGGGMAVALASLALLLGAAALFLALTGRRAAAPSTEVDALRRRVDSLSALVSPPVPATVDSAAAARDSTRRDSALVPVAPPAAAPASPAGARPGGAARNP